MGPLLSDRDTDGPGFYTVLAGQFNAWQGGALYVNAASPSTATAYGLSTTSTASGSSWEAIASSSVNIPHGVVLNALAPGMTSCYWDRESSLLVMVTNGMDLVSASEDDILGQSLNATWIGGEIVQYANVVSLGNNLWRVTDFLRGLRGTERLMNGHANGENFGRLTTGINRVATTKADLNQTDAFQAVSMLTQNNAQVGFTFTYTGNSLRPYTVAIDQRFRNVDGDVTVSWWPRVRQNGQWLSGSDVTIPANDSPETCSVDVLSGAGTGATVKNTYAVAGNLGATWTYTAAMQETDFGSAQSTVYLAIYQISTIVGRGFGLGVTA